MEQITKIKVVWICHFSNSQVRNRLPLNKNRRFYKLMRRILGLSTKTGYIGDISPWITNGIEELKKRNNIELHVISPQTTLRRNSYRFVLDGVYYYFYNPRFSQILMYIIKNNELWRKLQSSSRYTKKIIGTIKPNIINLIGAENAFYSCTILDIKQNIPIMVSLQTIYTNPMRLKYYPNVDKSKNWYISKLIHKKFRYFGAIGRMHYELLLMENPEAIVFSQSWCKSEFPVVKVENKEFDFVNFAVQLSSKKGFHDSIQALAIVKDKYPNVKLNLVGDCMPKVKHELLSLIDSLDLHKNIIFTPFFEKQENLFQHIQKSRFAVLPCKLDIISGTMIQSMAYGLPLVVYKTSGTPQLNKFNESVLVSELNNIDSLAQKMILLMDNPKKAIQLKQNAYNYLQHTEDNYTITNKLIAFYHAVINNYYDNTEIPKELLFNLNDYPNYD